ncbi:MAG: phosphatidate cytidylyltransferase [Acidobacteria bacterium]|nr:phosphatidate cytidylyltransferase [Acidobacteriota bacterium]
MTATRVLTALILAPGMMAMVWWAPGWLFAALVGLIAALALQEFFAIGEKAGMRGYWLWTMICAGALVFVQFAQTRVETFSLFGGMTIQKPGDAGWLTVENLLLVFALGITLVGTLNQRPVAETLGAVGLSAAGLLFVALPLSYVVRVQGVDEKGRIWTMFLLWLVWAGDSVAYFVGRAFGRLKMAPEISPKKTWEGAAGNLAGSLIVAAVFSRWLDVTPAYLLIATALANLAGQAGDLLESAYKRSAGVKDSGTILPGHGGVLDRVDALIFAAPVIWICLSTILHR